MDVEPELLAEPDPDSADSLVSSNDPDDLANEQTWPTEEELRGADLQNELDGEHIPDATKGTTPKAVGRIPKGMSEYQASWIVDDDDGEEGEEDEEVQQEEEVEMEDVAEEVEPEEEQEIETDDHRSVAFKDLDVEEEDRQ